MNVNYQPFIVVLFIKIIFSLVTSILSLVSYFLKKRYLIENDDQVYKIRQTIKIKKYILSSNKNDYHNLLNEVIEYPLISIKDPVLNKRIISIK